MRAMAIAALAILAAQPAGAQLYSACQDMDGAAFHDCLRGVSRERDQRRQLDELRDRQTEIERNEVWRENRYRERQPLFGDDPLWPRR